MIGYDLVGASEQLTSSFVVQTYISLLQSMLLL